MKRRLTLVLALLSAASLIPALQAQIKVACVGDSITQGWNGNPTFVPILQELLGDGYTLQNDGISGTTVLKNGDVPYWTKGRLSQALAYEADIIVVMLGTNDTKPQNWDSHGSDFKADYQDLVATLKKSKSDPRVVLVLPVPIWPNHYGIRNEILQQQIPIIKQIATEMNLETIDANTPLLSSSQFFPDGVHPNAQGATTIATLISDAIKGASLASSKSAR